jgi:excinuclease UvrABC nuclease subunit
MLGIRGIFGFLRPFDESHVDRVPAMSGVYVIYERAGPIYVGRSRVNIRGRLRHHLRGTGNRVIAQALRLGTGLSLRFEHQTMISVEQAEAQLIEALGTSKFANLRRESDPADR